MPKKEVSRDERKGRFAQFKEAAALFDGFRPARDVLRVVTAVPTCFVQSDHAMKVGGFPLERFIFIHGPSGEGKTAFSIGTARSFLERAYPVLWIDAEQTTPITWMETAMGDLADHPLFYAERMVLYEEAREKVRQFVTTIAENRGKVFGPDVTGLVVLDSIKKMVPKKIWEKMDKDLDEGIDGANGRAAQIKAAYNAMWLDELIPLLAETRTDFLCIGRETKDGEADMWSRRAGRDFKVGGGSALIYDSSIVLRCSLDGFVQEKKGEGKSQIYGERHKLAVRKTKVSGRENREAIAYFHTSNGVFLPEGFDRARDVLEIARRFEIVTGSSWLEYEGTKLGQGEHAAVKRLHEDNDLLQGLEIEVRSRFARHNPVEITEDGEVIE
jgi:recombination protein RecA